MAATSSLSRSSSTCAARCRSGDGLRGVGGSLRLPLEEGDQLVPGLAPLGQPRQVHQGGEVVGGEVQRPAEGVGGEVEVAEVLLGLLGDAAQRDHAVRGGGDGE